MRISPIVTSIMTLTLTMSIAFAGGETAFTYQGRLLDALTWRNLVVPAGGRIIFLNFAVQAGTRAAALAEAGALLALTDPSATSDLSPAEKAAIVNFIIP